MYYSKYLLLRNLLASLIFLFAYLINSEDCYAFSLYSDTCAIQNQSVLDLPNRLPNQHEVELTNYRAYDVSIDSIKADGLQTKNKTSIFKRLSNGIDVITDFFMGCDTNYVTPQLYEFTGEIELSYWHDYYRMTSKSTRNSMTIQSGNPLIVGGYIYWSIFGYGHSINIEDIGKPRGKTNGTGRRNSFSLNTSRFFAEMYTFNSGKSAKITNITDYDLKDKDNSFKGLNSKCIGLNAEYIFNHKKYSWPAAFGENAVQRKSCGSWKLGISYNHQKITLNRDELPDYLKPTIDTTMLFNRIDYKDYAISFGYAYNWVFKKNCLLALSVSPSIGYRKSNITTEARTNSILRNLSTDLVTRASLFWNNTKYFTGLVFEMHTYSYRERNFGLTNSYGTLKLIMGLNFLKKSRYKHLHNK